MVEVAIMGFGVVGSGVAEVLTSHQESIARRAKQEIHIKYILDIRDFADSPYASKFTKSFETILNDPEIKVVAEVIGGLNPSYDYVKQLLQNGKSAVTSNKELVAQKGAELLKIAQDNNVNFLFEASVGGGIPIIRPMNQCLAANDVIEIAGILNGTTNFILTKMIREQMTFDDALSMAQRLGYAERNPAADIEGLDACRKICILASLAYGRHVYPDQVHTQGITNITLEDVAYAEDWGGVIKLIGQAKKLENGQIQVVVAPMFVGRESQLAGVDDVFNAILVRGDATGDVVFYGKGAGKLPTASAVVADIIDCVKHTEKRIYLYWADAQEGYVSDYEESVIPVYMRATAPGMDDETAVGIADELFGGVRRLYRDNAPREEIAFVTKELPLREIKRLRDELEHRGVSVISMVRISDLT